MRLYAVQTADTGDLAELRDAAREGRAAAMSRRRALAAGKSALAPTQERVRSEFRESELRAAVAAVGGGRRAASVVQGSPSGMHWAQAETAVAIDGVGAARLGRALSMQRRRLMCQGKQALNGAGAGPPAFIVHRGGAH